MPQYDDEARTQNPNFIKEPKPPKIEDKALS